MGALQESLPLPPPAAPLLFCPESTAMHGVREALIVRAPMNACWNQMRVHGAGSPTFMSARDTAIIPRYVSGPLSHPASLCQPARSP